VNEKRAGSVGLCKGPSHYTRGDNGIMRGRRVGERVEWKREYEEVSDDSEEKESCQNKYAHQGALVSKHVISL